ncbi:MAG: hypothetical protein GC190_20480 [Alphaproteobacteria bacterium]|nr:hypothetical protein [Alphaproteobacteria bacterium]
MSETEREKELGIENDALRLRVAELEDRLQELQKVYFGFELPGAEWLPLTGQERAIAKILHQHLGHVVLKTSLHTHLYALAVHDEDIAEIKIVDVFICKLRAKIKGSIYRIETMWGQGYRLLRGEPTTAGKKRAAA